MSTVLKSSGNDRASNKADSPEQPKTDGLLVLDKPSGWTSHDAVAKLRNILGIRRIGHIGTLDPDATGLLPACLGKATRIVEYLMDLPKSYQVQMKLGEETDTDDASGQVIASGAWKQLSEDRVQAEVMRFQGEISQVPPMFSAIKKNGRRLYEYARNGEEVEREPRTVIIHEIGDFTCDLPDVSFYVRCSKGTYVRSLCRDIGRALGSRAHMAGLRRTESATFTEKDAVSISEIARLGREQALSLLIPMDRPLGHLQAVEVRSDSAKKICQGAPVASDDLVRQPEAWRMGDLLRVYNEKGVFMAIGKAHRSAQGVFLVLPQKVFCSA